MVQRSGTIVQARGADVMARTDAIEFEVEVPWLAIIRLAVAGSHFVMGDLDVADPVGQLDVFRQDAPIHPDGETTIVLADAGAGETLKILEFRDDFGLGGPCILDGRPTHRIS
jgi:hypothetical protein